jgi:cell division protein FtsB
VSATDTEWARAGRDLIRDGHSEVDRLRDENDRLRDHVTDLERRVQLARDYVRDLLAAQYQVVSKLEVETELFLREKS